MKLSIIQAGNFKLDGGACFGVVPRSLWQKTYPAGEDNLLPVCTRCLLVDTGERRVLIDAGIGDKQSGKFAEHLHRFGEYNLLQSLEDAGYRADDITDVILTHLHYDHCGGVIRRHSEMPDSYEPVFPNAMLHVSHAQWEWAMHPNAREGASFLIENLQPMMESGQLRWLEEGNFCEGISVRLFNGHTEGQAIPFISAGKKTVVFMADFIPTASHLPLPYVAAFDTRPLLAMEEKEEFLNEAADKGYILFFEHDYHQECCTAVHTKKGVRVAKTGTLHEFLN